MYMLFLSSTLVGVEDKEYGVQMINSTSSPVSSSLALCNLHASGGLFPSQQPPSTNPMEISSFFNHTLQREHFQSPI